MRAPRILGGADAALQAAIDSSTRPAQEKARDRYRHPLQTLTFFGIKPDMTVVEIEPGGGWYTAILAPYLKPHGKYYAAVAAQHSEGFRKKLADDPKLYGNVIITEFDPPTKLDIAPPGSADMVLTFRNVHNWMRDGDAQDVFNAMYKALKPGGILGVVDHRANPNAPEDLKASSGYVRQDYIVKLAEQAGFKLAGAVRDQCQSSRRPQSSSRRVDVAADAAAERQGPRQVPRDRRERSDDAEVRQAGCVKIIPGKDLA